MSDEFEKYLIKHRKDFITLTDLQEREIARLYIQAAAEIKERAKDIIGDKTLTAANAKIRINSLLREAARLTDNFQGVLDKALIESANLGKEVNKIAMSQYQASLKKAGYDLKLTRILSKVNNEAVKYTYQKIWSDGLKLSDRVWLLDKRTKQEIERIVMQNIISGEAASNKLTISALENLLNPEYTPAKLTSLHGRRVGFEASRLLRTEMSTAFNEADRLSSNRNPGVSDNLVLTSPGACEICAPKEGKSVNDGGWPGYHAQCRCTTVSVILSVSEFTDRWISFQNGGYDSELADWYKNIYKAA